MLGQPQHSCRFRLHQILVPEQPRKGRSHCRSGHIIEDEDLLLAQPGVGALGNLGKEDDGDPPGCRANAGADHQSQVHGTGHHQKADEDRSDNGLPPEPFFKLLGRRQEITVLLEFLILVHPQPLLWGQVL